MSSQIQKTQESVSSPNSTGGGGTHFEQHVDAAFLAWLLVGAVPPVFTDCQIKAVHFQAKRLGWQTDDTVVETEDAAGQTHMLACQAKQTLKISDKDEEFRKTIADAWNDFNNSSVFDPKHDRIGIISLRGTDALLRHFATLLDTAKHSRTDREFADRLATKGLLHNTVKRHFMIVETILNDIEKKKLSQTRIWQFLSVLFVISFDLNTTTKQTESQILSLLAYTAVGSGSTQSARITWNELLAEVCEGKPHAKSYRREDLGSAMQSRHGVVGSVEQDALQRLKNHSQLIFEGIRTAIGTSGNEIQLPRDHAKTQGVDKLKHCSILLISGPAGGGKSGVAKQLATVLDKDSFTFAFRAEEFAVPHFDQTLLKAQCSVNAATLSSILSSQDKKTVFVESVERLLEATTREAFSDLLTLARKDPTWQLVLTCRDYSVDIVRSSLVQLSGLSSDILQVRHLSDAELQEVTTACPHVKQALDNDKLKELLRNPYMLDKATQMSWSPDVPLPENERAFREKFWSDIIRRDDQASEGMPRQRQRAFMEVAVRRAQALSMYIARNGIAESPIDRLIQDSLLARSERTDSMVAPAHDVLEDWAILKWIDEQFSHADGDFPQFSDAIGAYPAIRRSYRKWLEELCGINVGKSESLFVQALTNAGLSSQFRDDTIVSLLRSPQPDELVQQHAKLLFENDKQLLKKVIHLLRVGCMTAQDWCAGLEIEFDIPEGKAWACVLRLVCSRLETFDESNAGLLLGLIEDASKSTSWQTPYPEGAEEMVTIAHWLLQFFDNHRSEKQCERTLEIIAKFPKCDEETFRDLLAKGGRKAQERNRFARKLREVVLSGHQGDAACRDVPDAVIDAHRESYFLTEDDLRQSRTGYSSKTEPSFGIQSHASFGLFPPSAFQGPFYFLFRHSYVVGEQYLNELMNHSADWFGEQKIPMQYVDRPQKVQLRFDDGTVIEQWADERLWCFYRSTTVGPYLLQSALMALEKRLFDIAKLLPDNIDSILIRLMKSSTNVAVTAVAASIATAHPHLCPESLKVLLRSTSCVLFDRFRLVRERHCPSQFGRFMSLGRHQLHEGERKSADEMPHRSKDVENAIMNLQLGPHVKEVHEILDAHLAEIPVENDRDEEDRMWLLALRRMDIRQYEVSKEQPQVSDDYEDANDRRGQIRLDLKIDDADVRTMSEEARTHHEKMEQRLGLEMWGMKVFGREPNSNYNPEDWKSKLDAAQQASSDADTDILGCKGPVWVACVCLRYHLEELEATELDWCINAICNAIESTANHWNHIDRVQQSSMAADRPAAWIVSNLLERDCAAGQQERIKKAFALALTHPVDEVKRATVEGVAENLWDRVPRFGKRCLELLSHQSVENQRAWNSEQEKNFAERIELNEIEFNVAHQVRGMLFDETDLNRYSELDISDWIGSEANILILLLLRRSPKESESVEAFERLACTLVQWWNEDDQRNGRDEPVSRSQKALVNLPMLLADYVLRIDSTTAASVLEPILLAVDQHPKEVAQILQGIVSAEDSKPSITKFWPVWQEFADRIKAANWLLYVDSEYAGGSELMATIFLTRYWKKNIRHWKGLSEGSGSGNAHNVHQLFKDLPATSILFECYCSFLFQIGESCLPSAFKIIAEKLSSGNSLELLRRPNTLFHLEALIRRYVYGRPIELKSDRDTREAVMLLLDSLIEAGSSSSYRMRDDFVTPLPVEV